MDAHAVHATRIEIKRTRALLRLFRHALPGRRRRPVDRLLRQAKDQLAGPRDAAVCRHLLTQWLGDPRIVPAAQRPHVRMLITQLAPQFPAPPVLANHGRAAQQALRQATRLCRNLPLGTAPHQTDIVSGMLVSFTRARRAFRTCQKGKSTAHVHDWRKRVKTLYYQLALLTPDTPQLALFPAPAQSRLTALHKRVHRLGRLLGRHHDYAMLAAWLREAAHDAPSCAAANVLKARAKHQMHKFRKEALREGKTAFALRKRDLRTLLAAQLAAPAMRAPVSAPAPALHLH